MLSPIYLFGEFSIGILPSYNIPNQHWAQENGGFGVLIQGLYIPNSWIKIGLFSGYLPLFEFTKDDNVYDEVPMPLKMNYSVIPVNGILQLQLNEPDDYFNISIGLTFGIYDVIWSANWKNRQETGYWIYKSFGFMACVMIPLTDNFKLDIEFVYQRLIRNISYYYYDLYIPSIGICFKL